MTRGEVWWVELPELDPHPALVLTRAAAIEVRAKVTVAPLSTRIRGIPVEVSLTTSEDGVAKDCVVRLDHVETVPQALLTARMTALSSARMRQVCDALLLATGCDA